MQKILAFFGIYNDEDLLQLKDFLKGLKNFGEALLFAVIAAFILKTFAVEAFRIPTGSMEKTLLIGDFLLVNKFVYGSSSPRVLPFTNVELPHFTLPSIREPKRADIVVFEYPGDREEWRPKEAVNYIKRLVGLPGDTVVIINKVVYVNGREFYRPPDIQYINPYIKPMGRQESRIYPKGRQWNEDNYGPFVVPKKGDLIHLTTDNVEEYRTLINRDLEAEAVKVEGHDIFILGKSATSYRLKKDYYFMMGDNRDDSWDSRYWGCVSRERIIGQGLIIYWSWDPSNNGIIDLLASLRPGRIARLVH